MARSGTHHDPGAADEPDALTADLAALFSRSAPTVAVLGDALLDAWFSGRCDRVCREAPVPVVDVTARSLCPGGAANTAANLAAMGCDVRFVSAIGDDAAGGDLIGLLRGHHVDTTGVLVSPQRSTVTKRRVVADGQVLVRFDEGDCDPVDDALSQRLVRALETAVRGVDALVVCDYGNGLLTPALREAVVRLRPDLPLLVLDAHDLVPWRAARPDLVTPNAAEAGRLLGTDLPEGGEERVELLTETRTRLLERTGAEAAVVTLDRDGSLLLTAAGAGHRTWAVPAPESQASGAGDTFVAACCLGRASGLSLAGSLELAQAAADIVVGKDGTAVCDRAELALSVTKRHRAAVAQRELQRAVAAHRAAGRRVVFTNGCFDVLHRGHIAYLEEAKNLGDVLIVAVNSDASVRRLKGPDRPVNSAVDRAAVLAALGCVDHVTVFEQDTPIELLRMLRPEVYVKGGDYTESMLREAPVVRAYGGEVRAVSYVPEKSTTSVIQKIRAGSVLGEAR
jgi:D-beta-D-heptose 7-phosphate kinase/D-beta-D-heptose 1-phosphate adenosyltransferase